MAGLTPTQRIEFVVHGEARPAGSKVTYPVLNKSGEVVRTKTGRLLTRAKHANPKTVDWMRWVADAARKIYQGELLEGPLVLRLCFYRPRPKAHFGTGVNAAKLKPSSPLYPTTRPDTVKLTRAVEDALSEVLWHDDAQIIEHHLQKRYGTHYYLELVVEMLD